MEAQREGGDVFSAPLLRYLPPEGRDRHEGGEGLHGRTAADDAAAAPSSSMAPSAWWCPSFTARPGICVRNDAALERQAGFIPSASSRTAAPGWKCSSTPTISSTSISTAAAAAGSSWRRHSCASLGYGDRRAHPHALLQDRGIQAQGETWTTRPSRRRCSWVT